MPNHEVKMDREERHQNHLDRLMNLEVLEELEVLEDLEVMEDLEEQETQMGTRGDQSRREAPTPLRLSTRTAGHRLRHDQDRWNIEAYGTF